MRFSTTPGDILADSVSTPRGLAIKIIGVEDMAMLPEHAGQVTQDFVTVNAKSFPAPDAAQFLKLQQLIEKNAERSRGFQKINFKRRSRHKCRARFGRAQSETLAQLGHPETNLLGETYGTTAALRYGNHIAKIIVAPLSQNLKDLYNKHVDVNFHYSGLRDAVVEFFKTQTAQWEVRVQLCTDLKTMPVEDPSVEWPEDKSPYQGVAKITVKPQNAYSPARRVYVDEELSFNPFHALEAHRPLGNIMRAQKKGVCDGIRLSPQNERPPDDRTSQHRRTSRLTRL